MSFHSKTAAVLAVLALSAAPAFAAGQPSGTPNQDSNPGTTHQPSTTPPTTNPSPNENSTNNPGSSHKLGAPGQYCKAESKKHVDGQPGTPFSACVKAQAKLRSGATSSPRTACKDASKQHVDGQKGTPFSLCVSAGAKLLQDQKAQNS